MEQISQMAQIKMGPLGTVILVLIGILVYNILTIAGSQRVKKFSDISFKKWWGENQIRLVIVLLIVVAMALMSLKGGTMTAERALTLSMTANLVVDKLMKSLGHDPGKTEG